MTTRTTEYENAAIDWAARGDFNPKRHVSGVAAQQDTRALLQAAGVDVGAMEDRAARGRPALDPDGDTTRWTIRTTPKLAAAARARAAREGRPVSDLVRNAVAAYLAQPAA